MKINESILFSLIRRGYRTLQIPDIVIGEQFSEPYLDLPEDFFEKLIPKGNGHIPSRHGFLFLSKKGYEFLKDRLKQEVINHCKYTWDSFEEYAERHFNSRKLILKKEINQVIDWNLIDKEDYLMAMERSTVKDIEIKHLLKKSLTNKINDYKIFMKGIDVSYYFEGYSEFKIEDL